MRPPPRVLLRFNIVVLIACVAAGAVLYRGAFGYGDALNMYNPLPQLDAANGTDRVATNLVSFVRDWYTGLNGRWSQAVMNGTIQMLSRPFVHRPESFPWWLIRSLSLFCIIATPVNFIWGTGLFEGRVVQGLLLIALAWMIWSAANNTYGYSIWFDTLLADRFVPMLLASILAVMSAAGWPKARPGALIGFAALYLFVAVEQFLVTLPIVVGVYAASGRRSETRAARAAPFALSLTLSAVSALIYMASPGQKWRNALLNLQAPDLSPAGLFAWFKSAMPVGYHALLGGDAALYWKLHLVMLVALVAAVIAGARRLQALGRIGQQSVELERGVWLAGFALAFHVAYAGSLLTLLVSPHFPEYASQYPALLLTLGLVFTAATAFELADPALWRFAAADVPRRSDRATILLVGVSVAAVLIGITFPALTANVATLREDARFGALRKQVYAAVLESNARTGATGFILTNSPMRSIGGTMEPPWGLSAYFRWLHRQDLAVFIDTNYDFPKRPPDRSYVTIDVARFWRP